MPMVYGIFIRIMKNLAERLEKDDHSKCNGRYLPDSGSKNKNAIKELKGSGVVETLVDNEIAVQNLTKMAKQKGYGVKSEKIAEDSIK